MTIGVCKLTHQTGRFVRSHLLPLALTGPDTQGAPLVQYGSGKRPSRRWSSWYDDHLVVRGGEDVLARLDNWAIATLRKHSLVWSGWGTVEAIPPNHAILGAGSAGIRSVRGLDFRQLRLFVLSLLWRAAATERPEFSEVSIPGDDLEILRRMLLEDRETPLEFYPATLIQISTLGRKQNLPPLAEMKVIPNLPGLGSRRVPFFRFFLDGLIVHITRRSTGSIGDLGPLAIGASEALVVQTTPYETSWQRRNLETVLSESLR